MNDAASQSPRSRWTHSFVVHVSGLPPHVQKLVVKAIGLWEANPKHRSLRLHPLKDTKKGRHATGSYSISLNMQYRALYVLDGAVAVWYWVGSHAEYDRFTGDG